MQKLPTHPRHLYIHLPGMPLATCREFAAHLGQLDQVEAELVWRADPVFDARADQIDSIALTLPGEHLALDHLCEVILFYADRYLDALPVLPISLRFEAQILQFPATGVEVLAFLQGKRAA